MTRGSMFLIAALALLVLGCPPPRPPLELHSVRVQSATPQGLGLIMNVRVNNNEPFDVKVRNVRANVVIARTYQLPPIFYNPERWLGANRSTFVAVPVLVPWAMIRPLVLTTAGSPVIDYQVSGFIDVTAVRMLGIRVNDHPLNGGGSMSRVELLAVAGRSIPINGPWAPR